MAQRLNETFSVFESLDCQNFKPLGVNLVHASLNLIKHCLGDALVDVKGMLDFRFIFHLFVLALSVQRLLSLRHTICTEVEELGCKLGVVRDSLPFVEQEYEFLLIINKNEVPALVIKHVL